MDSNCACVWCRPEFDLDCDHVWYNGVCQRCNDLQPLPLDESNDEVGSAD
jgi:hypothetical protein